VSHKEVKIPVIVNQRGGKCGAADSHRRLHKKETGDRRQICRKGKLCRQETDGVGMATVNGSGQAKR
jgi:hypothetical protein